MKKINNNNYGLSTCELSIGVIPMTSLSKLFVGVKPVFDKFSSIGLKRLRMIDRPKFYTKEELDAINYFQGTGFYQKNQNPKTKPNIFDTRQTFLLKMHDDQMRNDFLASFNRKI